MEKMQIPRRTYWHRRRYKKAKRSISWHLQHSRTHQRQKKSQPNSATTNLRSYIESIFLSNSKLWVLTKALEKTIDSFQRRLLRKVVRVKWTRTISNADLYGLPQIVPWSKTISKRRLAWFGQLLRLSSETPARKCLRIFPKPAKNPSGNQRPPGWVQYLETLRTIMTQLVTTSWWPQKGPRNTKSYLLWQREVN